MQKSQEEGASVIIQLKYVTHALNMSRSRGETRLLQVYVALQ